MINNALLESTIAQLVPLLNPWGLNFLDPTKQLCILVTEPLLSYLVRYLHQFSEVENISLVKNMVLFGTNLYYFQI